MVTAISPGTYDPVTNGHIDVIRRSAAIFDRVVIGVVNEPRHKKPMFTLDERVAFLNDAVGDIENVEVDVFSVLVVEFAQKWGKDPRLSILVEPDTRHLSGERYLYGLVDICVLSMRHNGEHCELRVRLCLGFVSDLRDTGRP